MKKSILVFALIVFFWGCKEEFEIGRNAEAFFHVKINKAELPVLIRGNTASGKIVVFINGGPGLTSIDAAEANLFNFNKIEEEYAIAYYDQRGTGNSQGNFSKETITMSQYVKDLDAIISVIKSKYPENDIFLMSHSFGGMIASFYLLSNNNQNKVNGWINIDGTIALDPDIEWPYRREFLINIANEEIAKGSDTVKWNNALDWAAANPLITTTSQKEEWRSFIGNPGDGVLPEENQELSLGTALRLVFMSSYNIFPAYLSSNLRETGHALFNDVEGTNLLPSMNQISIPTLCIWGRYDDLIPPEFGEDMYDQLGTYAGDKYFHLYYDSGHQPMINEADLMTDDVTDFIAKY